MTYRVMPLRKFEAPAEIGWMRLEDAEMIRADMNGCESAIGPRRRGIVYRTGYSGVVSTVHEVFVKVDPFWGRGNLDRRVTGWLLVEESPSDGMRVRCHMTSWQCDRGSRVLFTVGE
jgi:hypothetical protein